MADSSGAQDLSLQLDIEDSRDGTIVRCSGKIVSGTCAVLQDRMRTLLSEGKCIVLDLSKVSAIDSVGLGTLAALWSSAKRRSAEVDIRWAVTQASASTPEVRIVNPSDRVTKLLRLTRLDKLFGTHEERD